ncbi:DUF4145 domain-containing protein [Clostridioides sp. ES-S-0005-03]|uniref:hypothetical protein n=1 Tax=unclassified Clostridioides TaxID=2635829 RepID=UPI001D101C13|nr:hypothetical protein [Clostridioides sp. ES-S-0173-01]MCC0682715.1 DUF4145 domain-containing protein [Clostridioides sp. ES-S-0005-03]UDN49628.1 DUF4145 domain-containing protein [Clostridioides sp. ES-S-0173-01]
MKKSIESLNIVTDEIVDIQCIIEDECPICHTSIMPKTLNSYFLLGFNQHLSILNLCTKCKECFITRYDLDYDFFYETGEDYYQTNNPVSFPYKAKLLEFDKEITNISPAFVKIYNQSYIAEQKDLDEIAGMGYRKALEFLIKDYLISLDSKNEEVIKSSFLGKCINENMNFPELQTVAKRAVWLGNDHAHYIQKHTDKDLTDLKLLIELSVAWIVLKVKTEKSKAIQPK